jgi:hypothetical protein
MTNAKNGGMTMNTVYEDLPEKVEVRGRLL